MSYRTNWGRTHHPGKDAEALALLKEAARDLENLPTREHLAQVILAVTAERPSDKAFAFFRKLHGLDDGDA